MTDSGRRPSPTLLLALLASAMGCQINSRVGSAPGDGGGPPDAALPSEGGAQPDGSPPDTATADAGDAGATMEAGAPLDGGGVTDAATGPDPTLVSACMPNSAPRLPVTSLRRLTRFEYDNTVRDLLGDSSGPAGASLPFDQIWTLEESVPDFSAAVIGAYHSMAHGLAVNATKDAASLKALTGCDAAVSGEPACQQTLMDTFLPRVLRRPLDANDVADFGEAFDTGRALGGDFASGVRAVLEVALQSPEFLYRPELGQPADPALPGLTRPTPHEMASRLSYLLWGSLPDAVLVDAARADTLRTKEQIATQARRMLDDPRARDMVRAFYFRLFGLEVPGATTSLATPANSAAFPADMPGLLLAETSAFIDEVTWRGPGDLQTLLTAPLTFMNGRLAQFYGTSGVSGDAFQKVALDPTRRAGILMQGSVLSATSHVNSGSPVLRGIPVFQRLLCQYVPPAPSGAVLPDPNADTSKLTTRERYEPDLADTQCASCHRNMDPIGFAFEHFDQFGRWRDIENGKPIDGTGEIFETDARGTFDGPIQLVARLVQSHDAQNCYVRNWMSFGYGRAVAPEDACSLQFLQGAFAQAKGNVRELLVALTQSDAFLYKAAP
jgi:Protein of unknown function (DUF1592)/Protein of unknown function (DUF1588)/Protein of unknown function (DUF1585)/Protein of unknown function (DUF1595)/Protein of unknown function (DUF1587)